MNKFNNLYKQIINEEKEVLKNGTKVIMVQHPSRKDYSQDPQPHPKYGKMKTTGNYPGKEDEGLKGTIIGFDNEDESGLGSKLTYHIKLDNGKTRTYVDPESFEVEQT